MKQFLDIIDSYVLMLDENLNIIFCNRKLLKKLKCSSDEINNLKLKIYNEENDSIEKIINDINTNEETNLNVRINNKERIINIDSKVVKEEFNNKHSIFIYSNNIKIINYKETVENKGLEENIKEEIQSTQKSVNTLNYILDILEENPYLCENFKKLDLQSDIEQVLGEIHKSDLMAKDFQLLLGMSVDIVGIVDNKGRLKTSNQQWTNYLGWSEEEILGRNVISLIHKEHKEELQNIIKSQSEELHTVENKTLCKDNSYKWLRWNIIYVKETQAFAITIRDISKEKQQERKRKKLEEAIHLEGIKNEFFANMSHEFKTPLNIILGTMQLLDKNVKNDNINWNDNIDLEKYINLIKQNSYRLLKLINNLMDITKIENGYYEVKLDNHNIVSIIEDITLSVAQYANSKDINIIFDTNYEEQIIACDPEKIERILLNLLSNSIKHTNEKGTIEVKVDINKDQVYVYVIDDGDGIPKEKLPIIFNRYVQGNNTLTKPCEGSGIGLSLVKSLIQMHGGDIVAKSIEGIGSEFKLYLPNKTVLSSSNNIVNSKIRSNKIEMCNIEFSDIYGI